MENDDKIISIKSIKLSIMKRNSELNNDRNLEHNSHKPTQVTQIYSGSPNPLLTPSPTKTNTFKSIQFGFTPSP